MDCLRLPLSVGPSGDVECRPGTAPSLDPEGLRHGRTLDLSEHRLYRRRPSLPFYSSGWAHRLGAGRAPMTKRRKSIDSKRKMVASSPVEGQSTSLSLADSARPAQKLLKTPLFLATNAARYQRQNLIREIDHKCGTSLICFVVGEHREIERDDTLGFVDLLHNIQGDQAVDLMIHTVGGDVDAAQKLIALIHSRIEEKERF